jgi:hypothetical protein
LLSLIVCFLVLSLGGQQNSVEATASKTLHASDFGLGKIRDAAVAINAMYAASTNYSVLVIEPGIYEMYSPIKMIGNNHVTVIADQVAINDKSNAAIGFTFGAASDGVTNLSRCKIQGLRLQKFGTVEGIGFQLQNCSSSVLRDCTIVYYGTAFRQWADSGHYCYFNILDNLGTYSCSNQIKLDGVAGNQICHQSKTLKIINFDTSSAVSAPGDIVFDFGVGSQNLVLGASVQTGGPGVILGQGDADGNYIQLEYIESSGKDMIVNWGPNSRGNRIIANERRLIVNDLGKDNVQYYPAATIGSK